MQYGIQQNYSYFREPIIKLPLAWLFCLNLGARDNFGANLRIICMFMKSIHWKLMNQFCFAVIISIF